MLRDGVPLFTAARFQTLIGRQCSRIEKLSVHLFTADFTAEVFKNGLEIVCGEEKTTVPDVIC